MKRGRRARKAAPHLELPLALQRKGLAGLPFDAVFERYPDHSGGNHVEFHDAEKAELWRVCGSGVTAQPEASPYTAAVLIALERAGVAVRREHEDHMPYDAELWSLESEFLGGKLRGQTGTFRFDVRGVWIHGARAVLFAALLLGLRVSDEWRLVHHLAGETVETLCRQLALPAQ